MFFGRNNTTLDSDIKTCQCLSPKMYLIHRVWEKGATIFLLLILPNADQFLKFYQQT